MLVGAGQGASTFRKVQFRALAARGHKPNSSKGKKQHLLEPVLCLSGLTKALPLFE